MKAKAFPLDTVRNMDFVELVANLESGEMSLLKTLGADHLLQEMKLVGILCRIAIRLIFLLHWLVFIPHWIFCLLRTRQIPKNIIMRRKVAKWFIRRFFPDKYVGKIAKTPDPIIVGFSHPTLHEILSLIAWALYQFPEKENCFPVNLPWYECLAPRTNQLRLLGIHITPLITRSTLAKIRLSCNDDEKIMDTADQVRQTFTDHYRIMASKFAAEGNNTISAPSSTRQATIFPSYNTFINDPAANPLLPAMRFLAVSIRHRDRNSAAIFLPVTIVPPPNHGSGLNLFRRYRIIIGEPIPMSIAYQLSTRKAFDHYFLMQLTKHAPKELWYPQP